PDAEPGRSRNALRGPALLRGDPLRADSHQDPPWQGHCEQRPVAEPQEAGVPAREGQTAGAGEEPADEDHRSEHVHEQREVPAVLTDCRENRHAPGLKIMSRRMRTTVTDTSTWRMTPVDVRLRARSSSSGPSLPAASSSFALFMPCM